MEEQNEANFVQEQKCKSKGGRIRRIIRNILISVAAVWVILLLVLQIVLSPSLLTGMVNDVFDDMVDGEVSFGEVSTSVFKNFPNLNVTLHDFTMTYPSDRYESFPKSSARLMSFGCGEQTDTLASFREFSASVNILSLMVGHIRIPSVTLSYPRIYAKSYNDTTANWNMIKLADSSDVEEEQESAGLPPITIEKVILDNRPRIVYCSEQDTLYTFVNLKEMKFDGRISTKSKSRPKISFSIDSLFVSGRKDSSAIALGLEKLHIDERKDYVELDAAANTFIFTPAYGRMSIPISASARLLMKEDAVPSFFVEDATVNVGGVPMTLVADVKYYPDSLYVNGAFAVQGFGVGDMIDRYGKVFVKALEDIKTDAELSLTASFEGIYKWDGSVLPEIRAALMLSDGKFAYKPISMDGVLGVDASAHVRPSGRMDLFVDRFRFEGPAIGIDVKGTAGDVTGSDPLLGLDATIALRLDEVGRKFKSGSGYTMAGSLDAEAHGNVRVSQLHPSRLGDAKLNGFIKSPGLALASQRDSLSLMTDSINITFGIVEGDSVSVSPRSASRTVSQGASQTVSSKKENDLALNVDIDSMSVNYKNTIQLLVRDLSVAARNGAGALDSSSAKVHPFSGLASVGLLRLIDSESASFTVVNSQNRFTVTPADEESMAPELNFTTHNKRIFLRHPDGRVALTGLKADASARYVAYEKKKKVQAFLDTLAKKYPGVPKDSLFFVARADYMKKVTIPDWMTEKDFVKSDLDFTLSESMARYFRNWKFSGDLAFDRMNLMTPLFPLKTVCTGFAGHITNKRLDLNRLAINSGTSEMAVTGHVDGLQRALLRRGKIGLNVDITSSRLNINQLLAAMSKGSEYTQNKSTQTEQDNAQLQNLTDAEFQNMVTSDTLMTASELAPSLFVVPGNLEAQVSLDASNVVYSTLNIGKVSSCIRIMQRCVQITNTSADSNVGDMEFEGFYSTKTKQDLKTGFRLKMTDVTADRVIQLMPSVNQLLPVLKTFKGNLNGEVAATADLDTNMNIVMPSLNGVIRLQGTDLQVHDDPMITKMAKILKFKDRSGMRIDKMSVEGQIKDNTLEIFPFILNVDRYTLGLSGRQNFDQTFKYHVSVIKSPLLIRFGVDLFGDFEDFKFRIGKPKYKNDNVPAFSVVIDQASLNLSKSINDIFRKGVDEAIRENTKQDIIEKHKEELNYQNAVDISLDTLTTAEKNKLDE